MIKLIAFDLDNVLIDGEAIDEIAKLAGAESEVSEITQQAMEGKLDFGTALKQRVALLKGTSVEEITKVVQEIPIMEGAEETIAELKNRGYKIATISGSFEIIAHRLKDLLDLDYVFSNTLEEEEGLLTGEVSGPLVVGSKADILAKIMDIEKISPEECAAVGDGANDISMLEKAGVGVAFNAKPVLKQSADIIVEKKDLRELLKVFDEKPVEENLEEITLDSKKSFNELLDEKRDFEKRLREITSVRDNLNEEAKVHRVERDKLNSQIRENLDKALKYRDERDKINKDVQKYKKLRDEVHQEYKKMEWASGRREIVKIQDEIKRLEKTIETRVLDIRKENELVNKVTDLRKNLQTLQEDEETREEALELKEKSESYHAKVVELSDSAQETHEKMLEYFRKIDEIRSQADEAHQKFIQTRDNANQEHEKVKSTLGDIRRLNKGLDRVKAKERNRETEIVRQQNKEEKERAEDIYRKFREGKKLSTEELLLLQKHNIV
ncbi:MAG: phosphoserine phosphatase SerB [Methanobacteriaceae archaeon]|nr:phosphoserine phosphatase SerB [Methanobacteriaceae archaeon]